VTEVRPFARSDRDQLTRLVNAHIATVMPGWAVPVSAVLNQLERQPGEYIVDPWVIDRATFVGIERDRLVAAAHVLRYGDEDRVSDDFRNAGEIAWLICWPHHVGAGRAVRDAALARIDAWSVRVQYAGGSLPTPAAYGVSDSWPHVRRLYEEAGFSAGQIEVQFVGPIDAVPAPAAEPPLAGLTVQRALGPLGTEFSAVLDGEVVGIFEVDDDLARGGSQVGMAGWADVGNHSVREDVRGRGVGSWLFAHGVAWLRLGGTTRLLAYAVENDELPAHARYYRRFGLEPVNRTVRGWKRMAPSTPAPTSTATSGDRSRST